jgi:glycosyltransferase involved in cell wall biosynthesis
MGGRIADISVIPRYPDPKFKKAGMGINEKIEFLRSKNLPQCFALYVGNIKPHKNIEGLLKAFGIIRRGKPGLKLVCVGQKDNFITGFEGAGRLIRDLGLENTVFFTGIIGDMELVGIYNCAEVLVLPSFYEGFGLPPLEAMACGCPVVVSDIPPLREVCAGAAIYIDPGSPEDIAGALTGMAGNEGLRKTMIKEGFARAAGFSRTGIEGRYLLELEKLFRGK